MRAVTVLFAGVLAFAARATEFTITCDHPDARYRLGETATFRVAARETNGVPVAGVSRIRLDNFGDRVFLAREIDLAQTPTFSVTGRMDRAGFLRLRIDRKGQHPKFFGVGYDLDDLRPAVACPADFDDFWRDAIRTFDERVPAPVKATQVESKIEVPRDLYELEIPSVDGQVVWGYLSVPRDRAQGPFPLKVSVPGAGPAHFFDWEASSNQVHLSVNVHYWHPPRGLGWRAKELRDLQEAEDAALAKRYPMKAPRYSRAGLAVSREKYYFYGSILSANRALDWVCRQPYVDLARVRYEGTSQGGGFGLILTALNKHIRKAVVFVPALTDHLAYKIDDRQAGWPDLVQSQLKENRATVERFAPYFDGVNFAARIDVPIRFSVGFADTVCPPHAGWTAYNVCPSKDKAIRAGIGQPHTVDKAIARELKDWLYR